ncbi:hypothetical protein MGG_17735 [Pyricularia oryzae 70-15]|uniref:Uncharacterized protein n=3 Tax=Pyricularia oryzae TaxID=318829 RepID=G4NHD7_PYRO7|nr:uncharacterized protein MGG_17735 [Pyricularia oryzae 70-15]EHA47647.1 hypothetical protein MGG_17735 [Pyricularia oryzae 70-15]ELQ39690.1 hypothetical protein OOU_Y34scaffold00487g35 [Pyricularia oryzae Y34]KAI7924585.1 hypothetical protein M9X92_003785 [Pyricularia oryzae]KAI7931943.1 hypothetical protein M0657_000957 [Pyricularia oryzae]
MPRSGYDMGKHTGEGGTRSVGGSASSSSQGQSGGAKKGGKSDGSRTKSHGTVMQEQQIIYGCFNGEET